MNDRSLQAGGEFFDLAAQLASSEVGATKRLGRGLAPRACSTSSSPSSPTADGARLPIVAVTCGRAGRLARQDTGMRTTTPALSSSGTLWRKRDASMGPQRNG